MMRNNRYFGHLLTGIGFISLLFTVNTAAADFSARFSTGKTGQKVHGRLFAAKNSYRLEINKPQKAVTLLVDKASGKTIYLNESNKTYRDLDFTTPENTVLNPIGSFYLIASHYKREAEGNETIQNVQCSKIIFKNKEQVILTAWVSEKLGFPLKIRNDIFPEMDLELSDINFAPVDPSLMSVPPAFQTAADMPSEKKKTADTFLLGQGEKKRFLLDTKKSYLLSLADDKSDNQSTKGVINFTVRLPDRTVRSYGSSFTLPQAKDDETRYPSGGVIETIEIVVKTGGLTVSFRSDP